MENEKCLYQDLLTNLEIKTALTYMNTKIDIFQESGKHCIRNTDYDNCYEQRINKNEILSILTNSLKFDYYSYKKNLNPYEAKFQIKKSIIDEEMRNSIDEYSILENEYEGIKTKVVNETISYNQDFIDLSNLIKNPNFDNLMRSNPNFLRFILFHKYINYHELGKDIKLKYSSLLTN